MQTSLLTHWRKLTMNTIFLGAVLTTVFTLGACSHHHKEPGYWIIKKVDWHLDLTDAQKTALKPLADHMIALKAAMKQTTQNQWQYMADLMGSEQLTADQITALMDNYIGQITQRKQAVAESFVTFHQTLTAEQKAKLKAHMLEEWQEWMDDNH